MKVVFEDGAGRILGEIRRHRAGVLIYGVRFVVVCKQMSGFEVCTDDVRDMDKWSYGSSPSDDSTEKGDWWAYWSSCYLFGAVLVGWFGSWVTEERAKPGKPVWNCTTEKLESMRRVEWGPVDKKETGESCTRAFLRRAQMLAFITNHQKQVEFPKQCLWEWALLFWGFCFAQVCLSHLAHFII